MGKFLPMEVVDRARGGEEGHHLPGPEQDGAASALSAPFPVPGLH